MNGQEQERTGAEGSEQMGGTAPENQQRRRKVVGCLLQVYTLQLILFGLLAWFVHIHPILPLDVAITRSFQQNQASWLRITMLAISYPGIPNNSRPDIPCFPRFSSRAPSKL